MMTFLSAAEIALSKAAQKRTWDAFMASGTSHSANAGTLPYILRRCEAEQQPYRLMAFPGQGYFVEPIKS